MLFSFTEHNTSDQICKTPNYGRNVSDGKRSLKQSAHVQEMSNYYHCYEKQAVKTPILKAPSGSSERHNK